MGRLPFSDFVSKHFEFITNAEGLAKPAAYRLGTVLLTRVKGYSCNTFLLVSRDIAQLSSDRVGKYITRGGIKKLCKVHAGGWVKF